MTLEATRELAQNRCHRRDEGTRLMNQDPEPAARGGVSRDGLAALAIALVAVVLIVLAVIAII